MVEQSDPSEEADDPTKEQSRSSIRQRVNNSTKKFVRIIQKLPNLAETGGKLFFNIAKILIVIIVVLLLSHWMFFDTTEGTILQPFEISGIKNVSGTTVADLFNWAE